MATNYLARVAQVARKNVSLRSLPIIRCPNIFDTTTHRYMDTFSRATRDGESQVYVLPVKHQSEASKQHARAMVEFLRPEMLFLELDKTREYVLHEDYSEFAMAYKSAKYCGNMHVVLGDISEALMETFKMAVLDELIESYGPFIDTDGYKEYYKIAHRAIIIELRNRIMTNRLWRHAGNHSSILAIVGQDHLYGMRHLWHMMKLPYSGVGKAAEYYEKQVPEEINIWV